MTQLADSDEFICDCCGLICTTTDLWEWSLRNWNFGAVHFEVCTRCWTEHVTMEGDEPLKLEWERCEISSQVEPAISVSGS